MRTIFFFLLFYCCLVFGQNHNLKVSNIPDSIRQKAKAVVQLNQVHLTLEAFNRLHVERTHIVTIFDEDGDFYRFMPMHYDKFTKINNYSGEVFDAQGNLIKKFNKRDYQDRSAVNGLTMYADDRFLIYDYTPTTYPYTIKYTYDYTTSHTAFIPDWTPINSYEIGILKDEFIFTNESDVEIKTKEINFHGFHSKITHTTSANGFTYELNQVAPIQHEILSQGLESIVPILLVSPNKFELAGYAGSYSDWSDFGKWMFKDLIENRQHLPDAEKQKVKSLIDGITDDKEKVRILYQYMQAKTRYINVAIGIGGWQPYPAEYVSAKGYGDCKALSNYMMSLLQEAKIPSNYTVIYGDKDSKRDIRPDFASMQGNHIILNVPLANDTIWLECTSQQTAFNHLGGFTGDRYALSVNKNGGTVVKTQSFPPEKNKEIINGHGKVDNNGNLQLNFDVKSSGIQYDQTYYVHYGNKHDQKNWLQKRYNTLKSKKFNSFDFINNQDEGIFEQKIELSADSYAQINGNNLIMPVVPLGRFETSLKKDSYRKQPLYIAHGYNDTTNFEIQIPANYELNYSIEPIEISSEFGEYRLMYEIKENVLHVHRTILTRDGIFPKEKYMDYVDFRRAVDKADNTKLLLESK